MASDCFGAKKKYKSLSSNACAILAFFLIVLLLIQVRIHSVSFSMWETAGKCLNL